MEEYDKIFDNKIMVKFPPSYVIFWQFVDCSFLFLVIHFSTLLCFYITNIYSFIHILNLPDNIHNIF